MSRFASLPGCMPPVGFQPPSPAKGSGASSCLGVFKGFGRARVLVGSIEPPLRLLNRRITLTTHAPHDRPAASLPWVPSLSRSQHQQQHQQQHHQQLTLLPVLLDLSSNSSSVKKKNGAAHYHVVARRGRKSGRRRQQRGLRLEHKAARAAAPAAARQGPAGESIDSENLSQQ